MFDVVEGDDEKWHFRIKSGNGEVMVTSKGYNRSFDAQRGAQRLSQLLFQEENEKLALIRSAARSARNYLSQRYNDMNPQRRQIIAEIDAALKL